VKGVKSAEAVIDNGEFGVRKIRFETGRLARQANGSALAILDDETVVLSSTVAGKQPREGLDFFPLTVDGSPARSSAARAVRPRTRSSHAG
jgi:polyribonucleotide nucleotidyltransferase